MDSMIYVGGQNPDSIKAASEAIVSVLKASFNAEAQVAVCNCLAAIAKAANSLTVNDCTFTNNPPRKRK